MKILFIGDLNEYSRSFQRFKVLKELGHDVEGISIAPIGCVPGISKKPTLFERVINRFAWFLDPMKINKMILDAIKTQKFQVIWFEKCLVVHPETLLKIKNTTKSKLIFFSTDNMAKKHSSSFYFRKSIECYDTIFTITGHSKKHFYDLGANNVVWVDRSYDKNYIFPRIENCTYIYDVVFIGSYEKERYELLKYLASRGIQINIWGNNWPKSNSKNLIIYGKPIYHKEFIATMHKSKIVLNFLRKINDDITTGRTFEIPASNSFMLAERTQEHCKLFQEGKEAEFFDVDNPSELLEKVRFYLQNEKEREIVSKAGYDRCLQSGYSHHDRFKEIFKVIFP